MVSQPTLTLGHPLADVEKLSYKRTRLVAKSMKHLDAYAAGWGFFGALWLPAGFEAVVTSEHGAVHFPNVSAIGIIGSSIIIKYKICHFDFGCKIQCQVYRHLAFRVRIKICIRILL